MRKVAIITGGSSGMGFEAAKIIGDDYLIVIASRSEEKLKKASNELKNLNIDVIYKTLDISNKESIYHFINEIKDIGDIKVLIHSAGMSPHMGDYKTIIDANAIGSVILNQEILKLMNNGVIINVSSMSSYLTPSFILPKRKYKYAFCDIEKLRKSLYKRTKLFPLKVRSGVAYGISKNFLSWYSIASSIKAGEKNVRVISVSPGCFDTAMGKMESDEGNKYITTSALKRVGDPKEIAYLFKSLVDVNNSYLTGIDIKCDGGVYAYNKNKKLIKEIGE